MSVEVPIKLSASQAHETAIDDVNRWRGHCVERFARLERSMGEALIAIANASQASRREPLTFGQKVEELRLAISPTGQFAKARLLKALQDAGDLLDQRNRIVHASGKVWIDGAGNWAWSYQFKPARKPEEIGIYEQKAARQFEDRLRKSSQSLCSQLQAFSQKLAIAALRA